MFEHILQTILHPRKTGSIAPSSEELVSLIVKTADIPKAKSIVELGTGTGVITERILQELSENSIFFALEINKYFVRKTKKKCPGAVVYNDSAVNIKYYLNKKGLEGCDCIISSLPWVGYDKERQEQERLLSEIFGMLNQGGRFVTFSYIHTRFTKQGKRFYKILTDKFTDGYRTGIVWENIPPARVYCYSKSHK